jgi:DNA-directed RNA polymerase subunit K/omega
VSECPDNMSRFEFVVLCARRTEQLLRGCTPRVAAGSRPTSTAREEVASGHVIRVPETPAEPTR